MGADLTTQDIVALLRGTFAGCTDRELRRLCAMATMRSYPPEHTLVHEGALEETFYIIARGEIAITQRVGTDKQRLIAKRHPGEFFGEMALIENKPRTASATTLTPVTVMEITKPIFRELLSRSPNVALGVMQHISGGLRAAVEHIVEQVRETERRRQELEVAARIQRSLLPRQAPAIAGLRLAARLEQAQRVGGDCYDYFGDAGGRLNFFIADAAGHGVGSALMAATTRSILRQEGRRGGTTADVLRLTNAAIYDDACNAGVHLTAFFARYDPGSRSLTYTNAGHNLPILWQAAADQSLTLDTAGLPLGILDDCAYEQAEIRLAPGDVLVFYTDGIVEAQNACGQQLGDDALLSLVAGYHAEPPEVFIDRVFAAVATHCGTAEAQDDLAMVVMHLV
jgi:serine phosphatase RsbU (regulator of sigma subunit)